MNDQDLQFSSDLRTVVTRLFKTLRKVSVTSQQLSLTERSTLGLLSQQGSMSPSELASAEKITNQSLSQILSHLLELGLIIRTGSETDKRKVIISLSETGTQMIMQTRGERDEWLAKAIEETCNAEEQDILKKAIGPLTKIVGY